MQKTLKSNKFFSALICSVAFSRDNKSAFISDWSGHIKMINWQAGANSGDDFDCSEEPKKVGRHRTDSICLTKDEKYLLVESEESLSVFETTTRQVKKEINLTEAVRGISLIQDGKRAIIAEENGDLSILDLRTLKIKQIAKTIASGNALSKIIII